MALGFEQLRLHTVADAVRGWRGSRYLPLYAAGVLLGAGIGLGLTVALETPAPPPPSLQRPVSDTPPPFVAPIPEFPAEPGLTAAELPHDQLGIDFLSMFEPLPPPAAPANTAPEQVEPSEPAEAPAVAPIVPAPDPVPAPAPQPDPAPVAADARPNFYIPEVIGGNASAEWALFEGINAERAAAGLAPYVLDPGLTHIARIRSQQMIDQGYFGHTDPYGYSMYWELLKHFGYSYAWAGENLAMNTYPIAEAPGRALISLMNSPSHRANILASDFTRIGIGEVTDANGGHYFTMIFLG